jgi:hypothetical protein
VSGPDAPAWPTVIIGGAPRSGTSSLYELLQGTRAFRRQPRKELFLLNDPEFWIQGATPGYARVGARCYELAGFRSDDHFIDASTTYLYQGMAPAACALRLAARQAAPFVVVFCLREPAERLYSSFLYFRDVLLRIPATTRFTDHVESLMSGSSRTGNQQIDEALSHGDYPAHLGRWEAAVGAPQVVVVRTEDLALRPGEVLSEIGARIGGHFAPGRPGRKNAAYRPRFARLHALARRLGDVVPHGRLRERLKSSYLRLAPKRGAATLDVQDAQALERVRSYYRARAAGFSARGLDWYAST